MILHDFKQTAVQQDFQHHIIKKNELIKEQRLRSEKSPSLE